ncbi:MAG: ABC transporter permease [Pseudomonadota bacterium]
MDIETVSIGRLALAFIPVALVIALMWRWQLGATRAIQAVGRMLLQLTLVGYVLVYIFGSTSPAVVLVVLAIMALAAGWIALNTVATKAKRLFPKSLAAVVAGGGSTLLLITQGVLQLDPWFQANYVIPLAGMIFAASMTNISLALERLHSETNHGATFSDARRIAFRTAMIPMINSFLAVGVISLPGMMTGQILSGVSPLIAVRYQIMVMCMIFGAAGLSTACFLTLMRDTEGLMPIGAAKQSLPRS